MFQKYFFKYCTALLFLGIFVAGFATQLTLFNSFPITDDFHWIEEASSLAAGVQPDKSFNTYVYPATTFMYPMAGLIRSGIDPSLALHLALATFIVLVATLASFVAYRLWPGHLWWLAIASVLLLDLRFLHASPSSSIASLMAILYVLLLWSVIQDEDKKHTRLILLGICGGFFLATRIDIAALMIATTLPFLFYAIRWSALTTLATTGVSFILFNPYMWADPVGYTQHIPAVMSQYESWLGVDILFPFFLTFPFAIISIAVSVYIMYFQDPKKLLTNMPPAVYLWLLCATLLCTAILAPLRYHPLRYFMPIYVVWEILLPFWIYSMASQYLPSPLVPYLTARRVEWIIVICIIALLPIRLFLLLIADTQHMVL